MFLLVIQCQVMLGCWNGNVVVLRQIRRHLSNRPVVAAHPSGPGLCLYVCCFLFCVLVYDILKSRSVLSSVSIVP